MMASRWSKLSAALWDYTSNPHLFAVYYNSMMYVSLHTPDKSSYYLVKLSSTKTPFDMTRQVACDDSIVKIKKKNMKYKASC